MERIGDKFKRFLLRLFMLDIPSFSKLVIKRDVMDDIIQFAKNKHPEEFVAILEGSAADDVLTITGLYYQSFKSSERTAVMDTFLPPATRGIGSVHSHPSSNIRPSKADLRFFSKRGIVHFIIGYPYTENSIAAYDLDGNRLEFDVGEQHTIYRDSFQLDA